MRAVGDDVYAFNLASSGKLKLRAKALLAENTDATIFEACVLLHEAARIQRRAIGALPECPPVTHLASAVEECWCYVEGRDPPLAANAWGDVLRAREAVEPQVAESVLSRLEPRYKAVQVDFFQSIRSSPVLSSIRDARRLSGLRPTDLKTARRELDTVLEKFPGAVSFRWMQYRLAEAASDKKHAWDALTRCRRLAPDNARFTAMSLLVAVWALSTADADAQLAGVRGTLQRAEPEVCLMYALAEINLAQTGGPASQKKLRWERAREAADVGISRANSKGLRSNLKAVQLLLGELQAARKPTMDILYKAGRSDLAAPARADSNVVALLTTSVLRDAYQEAS